VARGADAEQEDAARTPEFSQASVLHREGEVRNVVGRGNRKDFSAVN